MFNGQTILLFVTAGCTIGCLLVIFRTIDRLAKGVLSIGAELAKMNAKIERIEAVNKDEAQKPADLGATDFEDIEAALANFEKLKRIDTIEEP